jgi:hypothetical protein
VVLVRLQRDARARVTLVHTLREELADIGQNSVELFGAERADFLDDERRVHREQLRRLHDRSLRKSSIDAIVWVDDERTVLCALRK